MTTCVLVVGDTFREVGTVYSGTPSRPYPLSLATSVKASVVSHDHKVKLCDTVTLSPNATGAYWPGGRVAVVIPKSVTSQINIKEETLAKIELQVSFNDEDYTWYETVLLVPGFVV